MVEIFTKALEQLTTPSAILALIAMAVVVMLARTISKQLPVINQTLGKLTALIERMVYDNEDKRR